MPALRAVLFDFFGTLTEAVTRGPRHAAIARRLGCDPADFARELDRTFVARAQGRLGPPEEALRRVAAVAGGSPGTGTLRRVLDARVEAVRADTRLRAEAVPVLRILRADGLRLGMISDCGPELPAFLPSLPVAGLLDATVLSIEAGSCKPDPALYGAACEQLGVAPRECLYVGDGGSRELSGAAAVGMRAVRLDAPDLTWHLRFDEDTEWSGAAVLSLADIPALVHAYGVPGPVLART